MKVSLELCSIGLPLCLILQMIFKNMLYYEFPRVFHKIRPRGSNLKLLKLNFMLEVQFGNFRFWTHARACTLSTCTSARAMGVTLEREMHMPRSSCVLQSARARKFMLERGPESHARAGVELSSSVNCMHPVLFMKFVVRSSVGSHARAELLCLHVRSNVESHARAWTPVSANSEKCFKVHFCILIPS